MGRKRLPREYVDAVLKLRDAGETYNAIALRLGVTRGNVAHVIRSYGGREAKQSPKRRKRKTNRLPQSYQARFWEPFADRKPREVSPPNALPWATKDRLMAGR